MTYTRVADAFAVAELSANMGGWRAVSDATGLWTRWQTLLRCVVIAQHDRAPGAICVRIIGRRPTEGEACRRRRFLHLVWVHLMFGGTTRLA